MRPAPPRVSVVIAMRDGGHFLPDAVASVRTQTHGNVELVVVDDGSIDGSVAAAEALPLDRLVVLGTNRGVSTARNVGIAVSTGELITFLDVDDRMLPVKIERQLAYLASHPECSCVLTRQRVEVDAGVAIPAWLRGFPDGISDAPPLPISGLIRRSALYGCGGFDPSFRTAEDMELLFRLRRDGFGIESIDDPLVIRRVHGANATYATAQTRRDLLRAVRPPAAAPRVSVLLVTGEGEQPTGDAVELVMSQARGETLELIVVVDGSTDDTPDVGTSGDLSMTVVRQPALGFGTALNHAVLVARGEYLALLGPGDVPLVIPRRAFAEVGPFPPAVDQAAWDEWHEWTGGPPGLATRP